MKTFKLKRTTLALMGFAFVAIGTYNSVVVNSDAFMDSQSVRFVKRLDEINGITTSGRQLAHAGEWVKLRSPVVKKLAKVELKKDSVTVTESASAKEDAPSVHAAIKEELNLELTEVFNAKKYAQNPKAGEFSGTLSANNGIIESISVNLPNNESVAVTFSEMTGNVFEYEIDGQVLSGMMYQMDKSSYMVTLTNGPFEGTRLKFASPTAVEENFGNNSVEVAENNENMQAEVAVEPEYAAVQNDDGSQLEVGTFGNEPQAEQADIAQNTQPAPEGGYGFTFEQSATSF
jgi:hypothetical protein